MEESCRSPAHPGLLRSLLLLRQMEITKVAQAWGLEQAQQLGCARLTLVFCEMLPWWFQGEVCGEGGAELLAWSGSFT